LTPIVAIMGTATKHRVPEQVKPSFVIFWHPGTLTLRAQSQSARITKITNDDTWCFVAVPM